MTIDRNLRNWITQLAAQWGTSVEDAASRIDIDYEEFPNREKYYPIIRDCIILPNWDVQVFAAAARQCFVLRHRIDGIRFNRFVSKGKQAAEAIDTLIRDFPRDDSAAADRINEFVETAVRLGYKTPTGGYDRAGAALLASLLLTSVYCDRFVDFRRTRWSAFAELLGCTVPDSLTTYGELLVWAGIFAADVAATNTFKRCWGQYDKPLWVVAGLCWHGPNPKRPAEMPIDDITIAFPEGATKARLHFFHERNQTVTHLAKHLGFQRDPLLRCEICQFSFVEAYGQAGMKIIDAHHTKPIATLTQGSMTEVKDIALICSNCHRMLHFNKEKTLTIQELREMLATAKMQEP